VPTERAGIRDLRVLDDIRELDRTERHREIATLVLDAEHASHHPAGGEQNLAGLDLLRTGRAGVDRPGVS
jgi:hypothetical protein